MKKVRKFDNAFKQEAIRLVIEENQPVRCVALDLGIGLSTLGNWVQNHRAGRHANLSDKSPLSRDEIVLKSALRKLRIAEEERDILKKALGIFSQVNR